MSTSRSDDGLTTRRTIHSSASRRRLHPVASRDGSLPRRCDLCFVTTDAEPLTFRCVRSLTSLKIRHGSHLFHGQPPCVDHFNYDWQREPGGQAQELYRLGAPQFPFPAADRIRHAIQSQLRIRHGKRSDPDGSSEVEQATFDARTYVRRITHGTARNDLQRHMAVARANWYLASADDQAKSTFLQSTESQKRRT